MKPTRVVLCLLLLTVATSCLASKRRASTSAAASFAMPHTVADTVLGVMDRTVDPCQDFYRYACGGWLDRTQLPADQARWGRGFSEIRERNREAMRQILEEVAKDPGEDPDRVKLGNFYSACLDEEGVEKVGTEPLRPALAKIEAVLEPYSYMKVLGELHAIGVQALFRGAVDGDFKDPSKNIAYFLQGGLGLPDRDYYLKDDEKSKELLAEYQRHVTRMLVLLGQPESVAAESASEVVRFETELARVALPRAELRDPEKRYHKIDIQGLKELTPKLPWDRYLEGAGVPDIVDISVGTPEVFRQVADVVMSNRMKTHKAYLRWHLVHGVAELLPRAFVEENFAFYGRTLAGQKEIEPRWKRCVSATDQALGEILGRLYVERAFAGNSKAVALEMIRGIEAAFETNLTRLGWMDETTRKRAAGKMEAIANKIGYPEKWIDYSTLEVAPDAYLVDALKARNFDFKRDAAKVGRLVDRTEWHMTPPTVNAYYNASLNEMVFPAGILQPPFFDLGFPPPMNFGGIGMVMGHELTHGFDDQGRKFDGTGRLTEWWEPSVVAKFVERAKCVEDLYSGYEVQPGLKLNGKLTLGENIADLGGIREAFRAWRQWAGEHRDLPPGVPGLTNDQLFFVGFAQTWCMLATPEIERVLATVDSHAHPRFRVIGPLSNFPEFGKAFHCGEGTPMRPAQACEVW